MVTETVGMVALNAKSLVFYLKSDLFDASNGLNLNDELNEYVKWYWSIIIYTLAVFDTIDDWNWWICYY